MRTRAVMVACFATVLAATMLVVPAARHRLFSLGSAVQHVSLWNSAPSTGPQVLTAQQAPPPPPTLVYKPISVKAAGFFAWSLMDRKTGTINGSTNTTGTNTTESMIKVWIAADFLNLMSVKGTPPAQSDLDTLRSMIRDSDDEAAEIIYDRDGQDAVIKRLIKVCGLQNTTDYPGWWSRTQMSAPDAVRMGQCVADGQAAGPRWTPWVLNEMRNVEGSITDQQANSGGGRWGIIDGLPADLAATVAIKNGWTEIGADASWHVDCLAINNDWVLAVLARYPAGLGLSYGAKLCASVAAQLVQVS